jgi:hypothetical protein
MCDANPEASLVSRPHLHCASPLSAEGSGHAVTRQRSFNMTASHRYHADNIDETESTCVSRRHIRTVYGCTDGFSPVEPLTQKIWPRGLSTRAASFWQQLLHLGLSARFELVAAPI